MSIIALIIFGAKILEYYGLLRTDAGINSFAANFIEWFGVLYGILLPLILVRVWEQLDAIDREFDREADAVKLLYEDLFYLPRSNVKYAREIADLLHQYVEHVIRNYRYEVKSDMENGILEDNRKSNNDYFNTLLKKIKQSLLSARSFLLENLKNDTPKIDSEKIRLDGDRLLQAVRDRYKTLIFSGRNSSKDPDPFVVEIFKGLNDLVDIRGDRIALASQRLFESLRIVALITSIIFLLPFYFVGFTPTTPTLDNILIVGVTLLVIFIYLIIEDFDEPFGGTWRITVESWQRVLIYMDDPKRQDEFKNWGKLKQIKPSNTKKQKTKKKAQ